MYVMGISGMEHDAAVCLIKDGEIVAAVEEERFSRTKHIGIKMVGGLPYKSIEYCLKEAGISLDDVEYVGYFFKPWQEFLRYLAFRLRRFPRSPIHALFNIQISLELLRRHIVLGRLLNKQRHKPIKIRYIAHHLTHAASTFLVSPFEEAAILTIDAIGEWATTTFSLGKGNRIDILKQIYFPHSWGTFYALMTRYLGFTPYNDEYKVMGLASYGKSEYFDALRRVVELRPNGEFRLNPSYFNPPFKGASFFTRQFYATFGPPRPEAAPIEQRHIDIAASLQKVLEECALHMAEYLYRETKQKNLCIAGGVGLNCSMNGRLLREGPFERIYVQPASHDAGCALGAAFYIYNCVLSNPRKYIMNRADFGPGFSEDEIKKVLDESKLEYERCENIAKVAAQLIADGKIVAWFQGRMEWGPRALGNRSILADPTRADMQDVVNKWVKHREDFRPFAPSVLEERASEYFEGIEQSPFMLLIVGVKPDKRSQIPAVTHVDNTARPQTVNKEIHPLYWSLIKEFERIKGVPVILNTSFNIRGEPIVCTPQDAIRCFYSTGIDCLVIGNFVLKKPRNYFE